MFAYLAIQPKRRVPNAHTLLKLIRARYGTVAHIIWIVLCTINNLLIFSSMLVGASASVTALAGMNIVAATYLLPLGVVIYTYFGGLRATCFDGLYPYLHYHDYPVLVLSRSVDDQGNWVCAYCTLERTSMLMTLQVHQRALRGRQTAGKAASSGG